MLQILLWDMVKSPFTSASDGGFEVTAGQQGWQLGKEARCDTGKIEGKLEPAKTQWSP